MCACEREVCLVAFVCCCFACDCVLELVVCRVRFARVSCPRLRFAVPTQTQRHTRTTTRRPKPRPTQQPQEQPQARSRPLPAADSEEAAPSLKRHRGEPGARDTHGTHIKRTRGHTEDTLLPVQRHRGSRALLPVKRHRGSRDTHGTHGHAHGPTEHTDALLPVHVLPAQNTHTLHDTILYEKRFGRRRLGTCGG